MRTVITDIGALWTPSEEHPGEMVRLEGRELLLEDGCITAVGGAGALLSKHIISAKVIAFEDLGAEAIRQLEVVDFPAIVAYDSFGNSSFWYSISQ